MNNQKLYLNFAAVLSSVLYIILAYFSPRENFYQLIIIVSIIFFLFWYLFHHSTLTKNYLKLLIGYGVVFRLIFIIAIPELSNDYFRFIWDGRLLAQGINPFLSLPSIIINSQEISAISQAQELFIGQGSFSPENFSCYPPLNQFVFWITALIAPKSITLSIIIMRLIIIFADIGSLIFGMKILRKLGKQPELILLFFLNPLIIIEFSGNLHFESLLIFFLFSAVYLLFNRKLFPSALLFSFAVSIKLIPLIFLPLLIKYLNLKKSLIYFSIILIINIILFLPFFNHDLVLNFMTSLDLYFRKFEFNASFYYIIREIGFKIKGYNIIQSAGPYLALSSLILTIFFSILINTKIEMKLLTGMLLVLSCYYFVGTVVMPWYLSVLVAISIFTPFRYPLLWSYLAFFSYFAYSRTDFRESYFLIAIEYSIVFSFMIYEIVKYRKFITA